MFKKIPPGLLYVVLIIITLLVINEMVFADLQSEFANPPFQYKSRPLWFWNGAITTAGINDQMQNSKDSSGYSGFGILPFSGMSPGYLSSDYFLRYHDALDKADALGQKMCLYDEYNFPSGSAGGQFAAQFPNDTAKRLDMLAEDVTGPTTYTKTVPAGTLMGAVAMNNSTKARTNVTGNVSGGVLIWTVPSGSYKMMIFTCVKDGWGYTDYLSPDSVNKFIQITHQRYYDNFPNHFGTTIDTSFYDEPAFYHVQGGRMWTADFNTKFQAKYGYSPVVYYPALWYDIGTDTQAARNALFGFRGELYSLGFPKTINDWCTAHGIELTGHIDQEEVVNPTGLCGDLIKCFKYQDIPGIDEISSYGRASKAYKVVSSAAYNYDRPLVMTETYGAMGEGMGVNTLYKEAMDQYAKGINFMVPHAIWYNNGSVTYPPELSYRSSTYGPSLSAYNTYVGRLNRLLQAGRHVADIGVLYPVATLQAGYYFGVGDPYQGGVIPAEADYMDVGDYLALGVRRDFTFIHPEVLDSQCSVSGTVINLNNTTNYEQYKVFVIPGSIAINWSNLQKIKQFYDNGGKVIATKQLPYKSAEFGNDSNVSTTIQSIFGVNPQGPFYPQFSASSSWAGGGYEPSKAGDGDLSSRWNAADLSGGNQWLEVNFGSNKTFNKTITKEAYNRVTSYNIQYWNGSTWVNCATGTTIGAAKTDTFTAVTASKVRIYINTLSSDSASIYEFEIYNGTGPNLALSSYTTNSNANGGKAYFIPSVSANLMKTVLDDAMAVYDVEFESSVAVSGGNLSYIHKFKEGMDQYFFANSSDTSVNTYVKLKGSFTPGAWDPHTGNISTPEYTNIIESGQDLTRVRLVLGAVKSVFIMNANGPTTTPAPTSTPTQTPTPTPTSTPTPTPTPAQINLALNKTITASTIFGAGYEANKANDGNLSTRWNTAANSYANQWLEVNFGVGTTFNKTTTREFNSRITGYNIQYWNGSAWVTCATGTTVGTAKTDTFSTVTATKVRIYVTATNWDCISLFEFEVYN